MIAARPIAARDAVAAVLATAAIAWIGLALHGNGAAITGPFIFMDELEYFSYARDIAARADLSDHFQYGVLFPAIASLFFAGGTTDADAYAALRTANLLFLLSSAVPAALLSRALFPRNPLHWVFPLAVVTVPFGSFAYLVWAEPLYYALFFWAAWAHWCHFSRPGMARAIACAVLAAALFHVKAGAGVVVFVASVMALALDAWRAPPESRRDRFAATAVAAILAAALIAPAIVRNLALDAGIIGYRSAETGLTGRMAAEGSARVLLELVASAFFQLSYIVVGTWSLASALFVLAWQRWRAMDPRLLGLLAFAVLTAGGLVALSALGMTSYKQLGYWIPNGRYFCIVAPLLALLSLRLLSDPAAPLSRRERITLTLAALALGAVVCLATPLRAAAPFSFVNNPELSLPMWLLESGAVVWRGSYDPTLLERLAYGGAFAAAGVAIAWTAGRVRAFAATLLVLAVVSTFATLAQHRYLVMIAASQSPMNGAMRFVAPEAARGTVVRFDAAMRNTNVEYIARFWRLGPEVAYAERAAPATGAAPTGRVLFVSADALPYPVAFATPGLQVYDVAAPPR